uniref:NAC domain-containing protein n=1 Tax=Nelumbo nucifera TaxID=4432 RepID=A0A822ZRS4_NELNU|nr:TPA_asm: hypothetical protein HUJ06_004355 [Nelumbo nucifera]
MTNINLGVRRLPVGYRFLPSVWELIVCYLEKKVSGGSIPPNVIDSYNVYGVELWNLPGADKLVMSLNEESKKCNEALYDKQRRHAMKKHDKQWRRAMKKSSNPQFEIDPSLK